MINIFKTKSFAFIKWLKKPADSRAFTLIEMLISITIFMIFMGIIAGSYTSLASANRKANESQKLYRDARFVLDTLSAEIHDGVLDYSCFDADQPEQPFDPLCIENQNLGEQTIIAILHEKGKARSIFKYDDEKKTLSAMKQSRESVYSQWNLSEWESLTAEKFPLEDFSFSVFPLKNPYESANAANDAAQYQPAVTIKMKAGGYDMRATYSSRSYGKQNIYAQQ